MSVRTRASQRHEEARGCNPFAALVATLIAACTCHDGPPSVLFNGAQNMSTAVVRQMFTIVVRPAEARVVVSRDGSPVYAEFKLDEGTDSQYADIVDEEIGYHRITVTAVLKGKARSERFVYTILDPVHGLPEWGLPASSPIRDGSQGLLSTNVSERASMSMLQRQSQRMTAFLSL